MIKRFFAAVALAASFVACKTPGVTSSVKDAEALTLPADCQPLSTPNWIRTFRQAMEGGKLQMRVGVMDAVAPVKGDVLYLIGFADRLDNHKPLFDQWTSAGFRVISFDYPSHGETCGSDLNTYNFGDLANLVSYVEKTTREDPNRPLIMAGWSTGGLLATRILQGLSYSGRPFAGAILFAPGIDVYPLVGDHGFVTQATLTNNPNPPHLGPINPTTPLSRPLFAADLLLNVTVGRLAPLPTGMPVLLFSGGDATDVYVKSASIRAWVQDQRSTLTPYAISCDGAHHELDNELPPVGDAVRVAAANFAQFIVTGTGSFAPRATGQCAAY